MKTTTYFSVAAVALLAVIQLAPVNRSNPPAVGDLDSTAEVKVILQKACYDCHSNETKWPFYSYIAPVSWMIAHEVNEGRKEVNFSEWRGLSEGKRQEMKGEILEKVSEEVGWEVMAEAITTKRKAMTIDSRGRPCGPIRPDCVSNWISKAEIPL